MGGLAETVIERVHPGELRAVVTYGLGKDYSRLVAAPDYAGQVRQLVAVAETRGWLNELAGILAGQYPDVPVFRRAMLTQRPAGGGDYEAIVGLGDFIHVDEFSAGFELAKRTVCSIILEGEGGEKGTGFLVGPDLLLTNYHVVDQLINGGEINQIRLLFDYLRDKDQTRFGFQPPQIEVVAYSPTLGSETDDRDLTETWDGRHLDYALLRLPEALGESPTPAGRSLRGWITLDAPEKKLRAGRGVMVFQHPYGEELKFTTGKVTGLDAQRRRVRYASNTESGSSGGAVLNERADLAALHHKSNRGGRTNQGIPITAIIGDLEAKNITLPGDAPAPVAGARVGAPDTGEVREIIEVLYNEPFIGRERLKSYYADLLGGGNLSPLLIINPGLRAGRSYLSHYFDRLAALGYFRLVKIDFRGRGLLHPAKLRREIALATGMEGYYGQPDTGREEDNKNAPFQHALRRHLHTCQERFLFFFDHCDESNLHQHVLGLIVGIGGLIREQQTPGFFVAVGLNWQAQRELGERPRNIRRFRREEIRHYLQRLHARLGGRYPEVRQTPVEDFTAFGLRTLEPYWPANQDEELLDVETANRAIKAFIDATVQSITETQEQDGAGEVALDDYTVDDW